MKITFGSSFTEDFGKRNLYGDGWSPMLRLEAKIPLLLQNDLFHWLPMFDMAAPSEINVEFDILPREVVNHKKRKKP